MNSLNKVQLIGNLGADPETRYLPSGSAVTNLRVATAERWTDKQTGEPQEKTEWHTVSIFGKLAEIADQYLKKGARVYLEGKLSTEKWTDRGGQERYTTKVIANNMIMLSGKPADGGAASKPAQGGGFRDDGKAQSGEPAQQEAFVDDDIPF